MRREHPGDRALSLSPDADIGLVKLAHAPTKCAWDPPNVKIATETQTKECQHAGCNMTLVGWGAINTPDAIRHPHAFHYGYRLRHVTTKMVACPPNPEIPNNPNNFCAHSASGNTDSGGPYHQVIDGSPTVFGTVSSALDGVDRPQVLWPYADWIKSTTTSNKATLTQPKPTLPYPILPDDTA